MNDIKHTIREFILSEYLPGESADNVKDDTPLRTSGVLDSMATLSLVSFLEERYGITFDAHETGIETFDRLEDIAHLVEQKQAGAI